ncbi:hypothetical protein RXV86_07940 [Alisedimentitalea sp. MJ-SS2]|uniref:LIC10280 family protein n=1 Tax=Aliisedimentitalea sp. MJ-SS2 TaxID=3049795 RepID=UPI00290FC96C|nr:hypothetical protein [Alisedimentitalea sp. MJ-SS2]MDU8927312.1 hypothetical protein [Alisedimentitalea sp. MJ-SS2]
MMIARRLFLAVPFLLAAPVLAQDIPADISGTYKVEGRNPDGSAYNGQLTVQESTGGAVAFAWIVAKQSYAGVGVRDGRVVTVDWGADTPVVYVVMPGGELHGTWAGGTALERARK